MENNPNNSNKICYKFEISLKEPLERNKLRANIFLIFANQDIQDEDVTSIGYVKNESNEKMCDSIVIWIATKTAADKMSQCLDDKERLNEVGFSGYKIQEEENFELVPGENSRHRSLSISSSIMTDGIFVVPESENNLSMYFKIDETSFYLPKPKATSSVKSLSPTNSMLQVNGDVGGGEEMDENNNNMTISSMIESMEIRGDENEDKRVEFYSNKPILDKDLSNVMLFMENRKASGGGDSISHSLDESRRFLTVQYENFNSKKRVLEKKVHQFEKFKFNANLPFDWNKFEVNPAVIILRGVTADTNENILQLYTENLVVNDDDSNDVVQIERSKLLQGVVYVTFKKPIDEERIKFRIGKKPKLNDSPISYMKAYTTNISVVRAPQANDEGRVLVESYFSDENRCGAPPFASSQFPKPFVLLVYNNEKDFLTVLTKDHSIDGKQLKVEYLYNVELFNPGQDNILEVTDDEEEEKQEDKANNTVTTETTVQSEHDQTMKEDELTVDEVEVEPPKNLINEDTEASKEQQQRQNQTPPMLTLNITQEPKLRLFKELSSVFKQFEDELKEREAICQFMVDDGSIRIVCVRQMSNSQFDELTAQWTNEILRFLKEFFNRFELTSLDLENPEDIFPLPTCIKMDPDRCRTILRAEPGRIVRLEIIGYKQDVDELKAKIENKLTENELVTEKLDNLSLAHARIMIVNKYDAELRNRFENLTCQVNTKDRYIEFAGPKKQVREAMQFTQSLFDSVVKQTMPVDDLVVQFFVDKEKRVVRWMLQTAKIKCVVEPNPNASMLEIYSTNRDQIDELCKAIKREFEPLTIDQSLIELVNDKAYKKFISQLDEAEDLVYAISPQGLKLCTFKADSDLIYTKFLEELPRD